MWNNGCWPLSIITAELKARDMIFSSWDVHCIGRNDCLHGNVCQDSQYPHRQMTRSPGQFKGILVQGQHKHTHTHHRHYHHQLLAITCTRTYECTQSHVCGWQILMLVLVTFECLLIRFFTYIGKQDVARTVRYITAAVAMASSVFSSLRPPLQLVIKHLRVSKMMWRWCIAVAEWPILILNSNMILTNHGQARQIPLSWMTSCQQKLLEVNGVQYHVCCGLNTLVLSYSAC